MGNQCSFSAKKCHENCVLMDHAVPIMGINFKETRQEVGRSLVKLSPCADRVAVRCYVYFEFTADKISG